MADKGKGKTEKAKEPGPEFYDDWEPRTEAQLKIAYGPEFRKSLIEEIRKRQKK